jgi:hypothetical protein
LPLAEANGSRKKIFGFSQTPRGEIWAKALNLLFITPLAKAEGNESYRQPLQIVKAYLETQHLRLRKIYL